MELNGNVAAIEISIKKQQLATLALFSVLFFLIIMMYFGFFTILDLQTD